VAIRDQLSAALALIELDGVVACRLILCPPDLPREYVPDVAAAGAINPLVCDRETPEANANVIARAVTCSATLTPANTNRSASYQTEWILLTSGTTGMPKMVLHCLSSLTGAIKGDGQRSNLVVWSRFYDIRRHGGFCYVPFSMGARWPSLAPGNRPKTF
jgi:hypothetical protein